MISASLPKIANTLFNPETGIISPRFKHQIELVGIVGDQHFPQYNVDHIYNVNETLEKNASFLIFKKGSKGFLGACIMHSPINRFFLDAQYVLYN